jgi:hypothetical protein
MSKDTKKTQEGIVSPVGNGYKTNSEPVKLGPKSRLRHESDSYALDAQKRKEGRAATYAYKRALEDSKTDESSIYNLELKEGKWMGEVRKQCRATAELLESRSRRGEVPDPLYKAAKKIECCTLFGAHLHHSQAVNHKVGTALCKNRLCPNCQRVLSHKRKNNFLAWFSLNQKKLRKYFFYHMVLTVRHKADIGLRTELYTKELLSYFQQLRGKDNNRAWRDTWNEYVAGGTYSTEIKPSKDGTAHIHIHILLLGHRKLYKFGKEDSEFMKLVGPRWLEITGDKEGQVPYLEPVYTVKGWDENGLPKKDYATTGYADNIAAAVAECEKYTLKADAQSLGDYSPDFLRELLATRNRYYGRFGCLHAKSPLSKQFEKLSMLASDFRDLEEVDERNAQMLINPETGEIAEKDTLSVVLTPFRNVRYHEVEPIRHGPAVATPATTHVTKTGQLKRTTAAGVLRPLLAEPIKQLGYYSIVKMRDCAVFPPHRAHEVGRALAGTVRNAYEKENDIFPEDGTASEAPTLETIFDGPLLPYERKQLTSL